MAAFPVALGSLRKSIAVLNEAIAFWHAEAPQSPLKRHLRSAVVQSFEFTYELSVRSLRRVLIERAEAADRIADLSFTDLVRKGADAGIVQQPAAWREWREMRNATSHAYNEAKAEAVALGAGGFAVEAARLLAAMESAIAG